LTSWPLEMRKNDGNLPQRHETSHTNATPSWGINSKLNQAYLAARLAHGSQTRGNRRKPKNLRFSMPHRPVPAVTAAAQDSPDLPPLPLPLPLEIAARICSPLINIKSTLRGALPHCALLVLEVLKPQAKGTPKKSTHEYRDHSQGPCT
jgi:hypothetical protein